MSKIEWTEKTWNPVTGCSKVSAGCRSCYAEVMHHRLTGMGQEKYAKPFNEIVTHEQELSYPASIKKPTLFFVNSMSDLFHEHVPYSFIKQVFHVMQTCRQHTFQVLTKRPMRMYQFVVEQGNAVPDNVWIGVSCENQQQLEGRTEWLQKIPAKVRFLSCEPLIDELDISGCLPFINWVIVGGETGRNARPMNPEWVLRIKHQVESFNKWANKHNVSFFFKQWGRFLPLSIIEYTDIGDPLLMKDGNYLCQFANSRETFEIPLAKLKEPRFDFSHFAFATEIQKKIKGTWFQQSQLVGTVRPDIIMYYYLDGHGRKFEPQIEGVYYKQMPSR